MKRMWINQPSTLQKFHHLHGVNVLASKTNSLDFTTIYFLSGDVISMRIPYFWLSSGWLKPVIKGA